MARLISLKRALELLVDQSSDSTYFYEFHVDSQNGRGEIWVFERRWKGEWAHMYNLRKDTTVKLIDILKAKKLRY